MAKAIETTVNGINVKITKFNASQGIKFSMMISKVLGSAITQLAQGANGSEKEQLEAFGGAIDSIASKTTVKELSELIEFALATGFVIVQGNKINHIDELEMLEDIDTTLFAFLLFKESAVLNVSGLFKGMSALTNG